MELKEAKYILAIADHKSISKAADSLFFSQPSLRKYLKNLELQLDAKLFDRTGGLYTPTYLGERYLHYARKIVALGEEWEIECDDIMHQNHGRLNIAIPIMLSNRIIRPTLPAFHQRYPHVTLNLLEEVSFVAEHSIKDHTIDLTFYNVHEFPKDLDYKIMTQEEIVLVISAFHPLAKKAVKKKGFRYPWVDLQDCEKESFILLYPEQNTGGIAKRLFQESHTEPHILLHTRNSEMSIQLAMEGVGLAFAPESYFHYLRSSVASPSVCLSVGREPVKTTLIAAYQKNRYLPRYARDYLDMIEDYCQKENSCFLSLNPCR